jgi:hypothetical protein
MSVGENATLIRNYNGEGRWTVAAFTLALNHVFPVQIITAILISAPNNSN